MTAVFPTGAVSWPVYGLALLLAQSVVFQQRVGVDNAADALRFIRYVFDDNTFGSIQRPVAIINGGRTSFHRIDANNMRLEPGKVLELVLTDFDRFPQSESDSFFDFANFVGGVIHDHETETGLADLQAVSDNLTIESIADTLGPMYTRADLQDQDRSRNYWIALLEITGNF